MAISKARLTRNDNSQPFTPIEDTNGTRLDTVTDGTIVIGGSGQVPDLDLDISDGVGGVSIEVQDDAGNWSEPTYLRCHYAGGEKVRGWMKDRNGNYFPSGSEISNTANVGAELFLWIPDVSTAGEDVVTEESDVASFKIRAAGNSNMQDITYNLSPDSAHPGGVNHYWAMPESLRNTLAGAPWSLTILASEGAGDTYKILESGVLWYEDGLEFIVNNEVAPASSETAVTFSTAWGDDGTDGNASGGMSTLATLTSFSDSGLITFDYVSPVSVTLNAPSDADVFANGNIVLNFTINN